ncbi:hypothetical protein H1P_130033 [Hyella patelloides LEGE 07179]|uniref:Uncharacterized protein n=1 Tax=Hyella patelloides LEGE 07179 TaxID=945734 RepID=A0A563VL08_9CYAN|nr:hypothetical protein H1P_130033 [Hyella patelloides LEGE 07179]
MEYLNKLISDFYRENNQQIIAYYPQISIQNYPQQYQL